jgi:hypothetical protein
VPQIALVVTRITASVGSTICWSRDLVETDVAYPVPHLTPTPYRRIR